MLLSALLACAALGSSPAVGSEATRPSVSMYEVSADCSSEPGSLEIEVPTDSMWSAYECWENGCAPVEPDLLSMDRHNDVLLVHDCEIGPSAWIVVRYVW